MCFLVVSLLIRRPFASHLWCQDIAKQAILVIVNHALLAMRKSFLYLWLYINLHPNKTDSFGWGNMFFRHRVYRCKKGYNLIAHIWLGFFLWIISRVGYISIYFVQGIKCVGLVELPELMYCFCWALKEWRKRYWKKKYCLFNGFSEKLMIYPYHLIMMSHKKSSSKWLKHHTFDTFHPMLPLVPDRMGLC